MMSRDDYARGAIDTYLLIMRAFQEIAPAPHDDPAEPTPEVLNLEAAILGVLREVANGRLALFDPPQTFEALPGSMRGRLQVRSLIDTASWRQLSWKNSTTTRTKPVA